jgi:hypothetical protein
LGSFHTILLTASVTLPVFADKKVLLRFLSSTFFCIVGDEGYFLAAFSFLAAFMEVWPFLKTKMPM